METMYIAVDLESGEPWREAFTSIDELFEIVEDEFDEFLVIEVQVDPTKDFYYEGYHIAI